MKWILIKTSILLAGILSTGCSSIATFMTSRVFEVNDISSFRVFYTPSAATEIRVEGFIWHSAMYIHKVRTELNGKVMKIVFYGALVTEYNHVELKGDVEPVSTPDGGDFNYKLTIPNSVDIVIFGEKGVIIWDRSEANNGVSVKKIK